MRFGIRHLGILLGVVVLAGVGVFLMQGSGRGPIHTDADAGETTQVGVEGTPSEYSRARPLAGDFSPGVEPAVRRAQPSTLEQPPTQDRQDVFADCTRHAGATLTILSSIDGGRWVSDAAICPLKGQSIALKVEAIPGGSDKMVSDSPGHLQELQQRQLAVGSRCL